MRGGGGGGFCFSVSVCKEERFYGLRVNLKLDTLDQSPLVLLRFNVCSV